MKQINYKLGELFCGPGGLALGAAMANESKIANNNTEYSISHVWGVDYDESAIETYKANIVENFGGNCYCEDASEFTKKKNRPVVSALAFGFPCNDFSMLGKRKGVNGNFGLLYKAGISILNQDNPDWFIAENVSGIHAANSKVAFPKILSELKGAGKYGYELTVHLYKFEQYGVPQYRHRYIIVGIRKDLRLKFNVPAPLYIKKDEYKSVKKAFEGLDNNLPNSKPKKQSVRVAMRLKYTPPWHNAWYLDELLKETPKKMKQILKDKLPWFDKVAHLTGEQMVAEIESCKLHCRKARMSHIYKRLDASKPSYTVTGSGGGGTHIYHWKECRALTNRERARLQSFPDWFVFKGTEEKQRKQIGMAVPPESSKIIYESIMKTFAGIEYDFIEPNYTMQ